VPHADLHDDGPAAAEAGEVAVVHLEVVLPLVDAPPAVIEEEVLEGIAASEGEQELEQG
jgi:hypothetical protein